MADSKHTPGPWTVDGPAHNQIVWSSPEERVCFLAHSNGDRPERDFANGRLIAAAPDLLELAWQYRNDLIHPPAPDSRVRRLKAIAAVIAKAEGRS